MTNILLAGAQRTLFIRNVEYSFHWCPAGAYLMGCPRSEIWTEEKKAAREVGYDLKSEESWPPFFPYGLYEKQVKTGFWILEVPVTQRMWDSVMPKSWGYHEGDELPIDCVSWIDAMKFCKRLTFLAGLTPKSITLPSDLQWEYACRAGTTTAFSFGDEATGVDANFDCRYPFRSSRKNTFLNRRVPVRSFPANNWGIFDMHGNVAEWCRGITVSPFNEEGFHSLRGGHYANRGIDIRAASCFYAPSDTRDFGFGFRIILLD